jgi:hypothetical protein
VETEPPHAAAATERAAQSREIEGFDAECMAAAIAPIVSNVHAHLRAS